MHCRRCLPSPCWGCRCACNTAVPDVHGGRAATRHFHCSGPSLLLPPSPALSPTLCCVELWQFCPVVARVKLCTCIDTNPCSQHDRDRANPANAAPFWGLRQPTLSQQVAFSWPLVAQDHPFARSAPAPSTLGPLASVYQALGHSIFSSCHSRMCERQRASKPHRL